MTFDLCVGKVKAWMKENVEDEDRRRIRDSFVDQAARILQASGADSQTPAQFQAKMQVALDNEMARFNAKYRATRAMDLAIRERGVQATKQNIEAFTKAGVDPLKAPIEAFMARIKGGSPRGGFATNLDVQEMQKSLSTSFMQFFRNALGDDEAAFQAMEKDSPLAKAVYQEAWAIEHGEHPGQSGDPQALRMAKALKAVQNRVFSEAQSITPFLEKSESFIASRNHNIEAVTGDGSDAAKEQWLKDVTAAYGKKSFLGNTPEEKAKIFEDIFARIKSGNYFVPGMEANFWGVPGTGGELAQRMAPARSLIPESWQAEFNYVSKYGDNLWTAMSKQMLSSADSIAKISKWGSRMADNFKDEYHATLKSLAPDQQEAFRANQKNFQDAFAISMGSQAAPATSLAARVARGLQLQQFFAKAGLHLPHSLNDFQNAVGLYQTAFGESLPSTSFKMAQALTKVFTGYGDAKERLGDMSVFFNSARRDWLNSMGDVNAGPGKIAAMAEMMGKLNLGEWQQAGVKYASALVTSKHWGELADSGFERLNSNTRATLARYGLAAPEWELIRQARETLPFLEGETRSLLTPDAIRNLDKAPTEAYLRSTGQWTQDGPPPQTLLDRAKYQAALKWGGMLNEFASLSAANPLTRQKAFMFGNTTQNDSMGLLRRMLWQFKQASLTSLDVSRRIYFSGEGSKSNYSGLASHLVMGAFYALMGDYLYQAASGKSLEDPASPRMLAVAGAGSGGNGIWLDALIRATQAKSVRDGVSAFAEAAGGPVLSTLAETGVTATLTAKGAYERSTGNWRASLQGREWAKLLSSNIPGQNLFYTKAAMNYFLTNELHEFLGDRGYPETLRKQAREHGQTYTTPPYGDLGTRNYWEGQ